MSSIQSILPTPNSALDEQLSMTPGQEFSFGGRCYFILKEGSFEMKHEKDEYLEIEYQSHSCGEYFYYLIQRKKYYLVQTKKIVFFIRSDSFLLKAGGNGCIFDLYYPPIEKKDWGISGAEKTF